MTANDYKRVTGVLREIGVPEGILLIVAYARQRWALGDAAGENSALDDLKNAVSSWMGAQER